MGLPFYAYSDVQRHWAKEGQTSLFLLVPWLDSDKPMPPREELLLPMLQRLGVDRTDVTCGAEGYGPEEWIANYNSFRGNAFGHANILSQSMWLKVRRRTHLGEFSATFPCGSLDQTINFCSSSYLPVYIFI